MEKINKSQSENYDEIEILESEEVENWWPEKGNQQTSKQKRNDSYQIEDPVDVKDWWGTVDEKRRSFIIVAFTLTYCFIAIHSAFTGNMKLLTDMLIMPLSYFVGYCAGGKL